MKVETISLVEVKKASVLGYSGIVFPDTNWTIRSGELWAIIGNNASGKTTLLKFLAGRIPLAGGKLRFPFLEDSKGTEPYTQGAHYSQFISLVEFHAGSSLLRHPDMYYQQRYHSSESQGTVPVWEFLLESLEIQNQPPLETRNPKEPIKYWADKLGISCLLDRVLSQLSNGESKKLIILRALIREPRLLFLDAPYSGLDAPSRLLLHDLLERIPSLGLGVVVTSLDWELPPPATHIIKLDSMTIAWQGRVMDYPSGEQLDSMIPGTCPSPLPPFSIPGVSLKFREFRLAVSINQIVIRYGVRNILKGIDWEIRKGECWALLGPNGSGKSTLLSIILADNPQAYANEITLFDRPRGSGESIWEIKRMIGFISSELHLFCNREINCLDLVCSGWTDSLGSPGIADPELVRRSEYLLGYLKISRLKSHSFLRVSSGEQRLVLLARALVKDPPLLVLDEPFQGLDRRNRDLVLGLLGQIGPDPERTLVLVTHYPEEIPRWVDHLLILDAGTIAFRGKAELKIVPK